MVLSQLAYEDLIAVECVSRRLRNLSRDEVFWKRKFVLDFIGKCYQHTCTTYNVAGENRAHTTQVNSLLTSLTLEDAFWKDIYLDYYLLYDWVNDLLLDETFNFKYDVKISFYLNELFLQKCKCYIYFATMKINK